MHYTSITKLHAKPFGMLKKKQFQGRIARNKYKTKEIFRCPNKLFTKSDLPIQPEHNNFSVLADEINNFFADKVTTVWLTIIEIQEIKEGNTTYLKDHQILLSLQISH